MNTPNPSSPAVGPPTSPAMPTIGSVIGSVLGGIVVTKAGLGADPVLGGTVLTGITAVVTGLFHWLGTRLGQSW